MDAIEIFADHVLRSDFDSLSPDAVGATRTFIQDSLGVGIVGSAAPQVDEMRRAAALWGAGDDARVWVSGESLPAPSAAFLNAFLTHNSEFDCVHEPAVVHCVTVVLAACMAVAERHGGVSGRALMAAVALGVDIACVLGVAAKSGLRFFRPATAGTFAATMGIGKICGFDRDQLIRACSIAYGQVGGTMQAHTEGSSLLAVQMGFAARNAVMACDLAAEGIVGPRKIIEGEFGYLNLIEDGYDFADLLTNLGKTWRITEVAHKPFPSGRATHGVVDCCLRLMRDHGFKADKVVSVVCDVPPLIHQLVGRPPSQRMTPNYARLCSAYTVARTLTHGTIDVAHFWPGNIANDTIQDLAKRVKMRIDDNPDPNALTPVTVSIALKDGANVSATCEFVLGNPQNPLDREAHLAKFRQNCASARPVVSESQAEALISRTDDLENECDVATLVDLMIT
jgi:aconitate decarboxylase